MPTKKKSSLPNVAIGGFGQPWRVRVVPYLRGKWGYCDYEKREIVLCRTTQKQGIDREILIHELLHKLMPFLDEDCVIVAAQELDDALEACGH